MKAGLIIVVSAGLNLALAGVAIHLLKGRSSTLVPAPRQTLTQTTSTTKFVTNTPVASVAYVTNRSDWFKVETNDWELLAANLRAVGCPEKTVRDIIFARAKRALDKINSARGQRQTFWMAGRRLEQSVKENAQLLLVERTKIREQVRRAVGSDFIPETSRDSFGLEEQALTRFVFGPMTEDSYQRLVIAFTRFDNLKTDLNARAGGVWLEEDEAELKDYRTAMRQELSAALTPGQFEELSARSAGLESFEKVLFEATDLTPVDVRQIALIRAKISEPFGGDSLLFLWSHSATDENEEKFQLAVRQFLGDDRYKQFERANDGDFKELYELGNDKHLPKETAVKVYEISKLIEQEVQQLQRDKSLSAAERNQQLEQIQNQTQEAVLKLLGAEACQEYLSRSGRWVTNIINL